MGIAVYPYLEALKGEKIENIIPMLQTIPVFSYVLANIVLGESMSIWSIIIMIAVVGTTMLFSRDLQAKKYNRKGILLMLLSSLFYGLSYVSFKF
jgi:drug/metabolite transporter (DMT)-like permease